DGVLDSRRRGDRSSGRAAVSGDDGAERAGAVVGGGAGGSGPRGRTGPAVAGPAGTGPVPRTAGREGLQNCGPPPPCGGENIGAGVGEQAPRAGGDGAAIRGGSTLQACGSFGGR